MANPIPMLRQVTLAIPIMLLGLSAPLQAQEKSSNKKVGNTAKIPAVGTRFNCHYEFQHQIFMSAEVEGEKLPGEDLKEMKGGYQNAFCVTVLDTSNDRIEKISIVLQADEKRDDTRGQELDAILEKQGMEREENLKTVIGKTFIATAKNDSIKLEDAEGKPVTKNLAKLIPVPDNYVDQICGFHDPADNAARPRLFDPGHRLLESLPWKELTKAGESAEFPKDVASAIIKPGPGWNASSVKSAQLLFLEQKKLDGVDCKRLKLVIKASGAHREQFGGLPSKSTISWEAELTLEEETGWIREFVHSRETITNSEGLFQVAKKMKMDSKTIIKGKAIITPSK